MSLPSADSSVSPTHTSWPTVALLLGFGLTLGLLIILGRSHDLGSERVVAYPAADPSAVQAVRVEGTIETVRHQGNGMWSFDLKTDQAQLTVSAFPSIGLLRTVPHIGERIEAVGLLGEYRGVPQVTLLSRDALRVTGPGIQDALGSLMGVEVHLGQRVHLRGLHVIAANLRRTRSGDPLLSYRVESADGAWADGVFFAEAITDDLLPRLERAREGYGLELWAKVTQFRDQTSLVGEQVAP